MLFIAKDNQTYTTFTVIINNISYTFQKDLRANSKEQLRLLADHIGYPITYASTKMLRGYIQQNLSFRTMEEAYERWPILKKTVSDEELETYYEELKEFENLGEFENCWFNVRKGVYDRLCALDKK